jgi:hypothetical protein
MYIYHIFLIHLSFVGNLGCFHSLANVTTAAMNNSVQVSPLYPDLCSFGYMPRSDIIGLYGSSISSFLRNLHTTFHSGYTNFHSHQQCIRVPVLPHPRRHLLLSLPLNMAILTGMWLNLSVLLLCISLIARQIEHFFMYLLVICTSSFENSQFNSCAYFFIEMLILWRLSFLSCCRF